MRRSLISVILFLLALIYSRIGTAQSEKSIEVLNIVWNTLNTHYFDSTFSGIDWQEQYSYYKPIIQHCQDQDSVYYYLNQMLFKLGVSHLGVVSEKEANQIGDPQLFLDGTLGIDIRFIDNSAVITSVKENTPASDAEFQSGFILLEINNESVEHLIAKRKAEPTPPFNDRNLKSMTTQDVIRKLYGSPGDSVRLKFLDANNESQQKTLRFRDRSSRKTQLHPDLPPIYAQFTKKALSGNVGYIRFDVFHPVLLDTVISGIQEFKDKTGIIIDIRGNPGGDFNTRRAIASQFVSEQTLFWRYRRRNGSDEVYLSPPEDPYKGELVVLIDELSGSSSEEFAGGMKAIGRATIIGSQTAGKVLTMEVVQLPEGAIFVYPNAQTLTSTNEVLEGVGVIPDIDIPLSYEDVVKGRDTQLEAAREFLLSKRREPEQK